MQAYVGIDSNASTRWSSTIGGINMLCDYECPKCHEKDCLIIDAEVGDSEDLSPDPLKCVKCGYVFYSEELGETNDK